MKITNINEIGPCEIDIDIPNITRHGHLRFIPAIDQETLNRDLDCITQALFGEHVYREAGKNESLSTLPYNADYFEYIPVDMYTAKIKRHTWIHSHSSWSAGWWFIADIYQVQWKY